VPALGLIPSTAKRIKCIMANFLFCIFYHNFKKSAKIIKNFEVVAKEH
jgi:hypothetical protein